MRRPFISTCALVLALVPSALYAQDPAPAAAAQPPKEPKLTFATDAGALLVQIKGDQTAVFEELVTRLRTIAGKTEDANLKAQITNLKVYKTTEGAPGGNALYVMVFDPVTKSSEYELFAMLQKGMTPDELRTPETQEFFKKAVAAFAAGLNKLSLTPVAK